MEIQQVNNGGLDRISMAQPQLRKVGAQAGEANRTEEKAAPPKTGGLSPVAESSPKPVAAASNAASAGSTSPKIYDKRDLNHDGVVSREEKVKYALKHPTVGGGSTPPASTSQANQAVAAYQQTPSKEEAAQPETKPVNKPA